MTIKVGDHIPTATLHRMTEEGPKPVKTDDIFHGKKVVLFAVPGAFTPGCSNTHMPGFVVHADDIKAKGVDTIACVAVNDAFVMDAWGKNQNADNLLMLADGNAEFTKALGLELDASGFGLGTRSKRYSMIVDHGKVTALNVEPDGAGIEVSTAEKILDQL
jgi:peroxiredoxin